MPLNIRDPRAHILAKKLADARHITMTAAIIQALEKELKHEQSRIPLKDQFALLAAQIKAESSIKGRSISRDEIDSMWEH
jgi:antitoxin VapB